jgi:hypothetical protein
MLDRQLQKKWLLPDSCDIRGADFTVAADDWYAQLSRGANRRVFSREKFSRMMHRTQ